MAEVVRVPLGKPVPAPDSLIARMKVALPTARAGVFLADAIGANAAERLITVRFPEVTIQLRAGVKICIVAARDFREVGGVFGVVRHEKSCPSSQVSVKNSSPTKECDRPSSQVSNKNLVRRQRSRPSSQVSKCP